MPEARIRATTFPLRDQAALLRPRQWDSQIHRAVRETNRIYGNHNNAGLPPIRFTLSNVTHLSYDASATSLTQSVREQSRVEGISPHAVFRRERVQDPMIQELRHGFSGRFYYGGFTVDTPGGRTDEATGETYQPVSNEALNILQMNRVGGEIATYWVPGCSAGCHGISYFPEKHPGVTHQTEGIFISFQTADDILAHELGHLLMRSGHCTYEGEGGDVEGSAPVTNLMHKFNAARRGQDLTGGQIRRMLAENRVYLR